MSIVGELDRDVMDCGGPTETWQEMVKHLRWRAANSRGLSRDSRKSSEDMAETADFFAGQAEDFDALASALEHANITFASPALVAGAQSAETNEDLAQSEGRQSGGSASERNAQPSSPLPPSKDSSNED
jgi:hypothetical protein